MLKVLPRLKPKQKLQNFVVSVLLALQILRIDLKLRLFVEFIEIGIGLLKFGVYC